MTGSPSVVHHGGSVTTLTLPGATPPAFEVIHSSGIASIPGRVRQAANALPEIQYLRGLQLEIAEVRRERDAVQRQASDAMSARCRSEGRGRFPDAASQTTRDREGVPVIPSPMASYAEAARMELNEHLSATAYAAAEERLAPLHMKLSVAEHAAREALERLVAEVLDGLRRQAAARRQELIEAIRAAIPDEVVNELILWQAIEDDIRASGPLVRERVQELTRGVVAELLLPGA